MIRFILILCLFILGACSSKDSLLPEGDRLGNQIIFELGKKMQDKGLKLIAFGGAEANGKTWNLDASFKANFELTLPEARKLIVELVDDFLQMINADEKLRPYLSEFPFTVKNLSLTIFGKNQKKTDQFLLCVYSEKADISYLKNNPNGGMLLTEFEETYEEAVQRLNESDLKAS